jgi:Taurine catabolism dioxygenase TauD, TfdA family
VVKLGANNYETEHPVVRVHPGTGNGVLLLGHFIKQFIGLGPTESATLFNLLQARVTKLENTIRWSWQPAPSSVTPRCIGTWSVPSRWRADYSRSISRAMSALSSQTCRFG